MKLLGRYPNDVLMEIIGPITDVNYASDEPPVVYVQVIGTGKVQVFESTDWENAGPSGAQHLHNIKPTASDWLPASAEIGQVDGRVMVELTPGTDFSNVRLILTEAGNGQVNFAPFWVHQAGGGAGAPGPQGYTGSAGIQGFTGSIGGIGFTGSRGFTGSAGVAGGVGFTGSTGTAGSAGAVGFTGSNGFTGSAGTAGGVGFTGSRGATGFTGSQGVQGPTGLVSLFDTSGAVAGTPKMWMGTVTATAGAWTVDYTTAGFTQVPLVIAVGDMTSAAAGDQNHATVDLDSRTVTSASGGLTSGAVDTDALTLADGSVSILVVGV